MTNGSSEKSIWTVGHNHHGEVTRRLWLLLLPFPFPALFKMSSYVLPYIKVYQASIINILDQIFFVVGCCLQHWRIFSHISGFYPLDAKINPSMTTEMFLDNDKYPLGAKSPRENCSSIRNKNYLFPRNSGEMFLTNFMCSVIYKSYYIFWIQWLFFL